MHHVFPSFHGPDVRKHFLSHVLKELRSKGIDVFIDNDIERSKSIGPELIEAIKGSRIAIVLLSKNYASSTWCLNELVEIIKCRENLGQKVMPIFYEVDPTDIKKQTGDFGKVFKRTCEGKTEEEIRRWKYALTEVAQIAGYHSSSTKWETEAEMIEAIATEVSNKLNLSAPCSDFDGLVGMESQMKEMRPLLQLDSDEVRKIGIWGPPGIGKTTIARYIFNRYSQDFQTSVFIDNIRRNYPAPACSDKHSVKLYLEKKLMSQVITNDKDIKVSHLGVAKDRLKGKKVLVVLDDVDQSVQVEAMANETCVGPGSLIIITTQDRKVLNASGIDHIHKVDLPSFDEALQIFCINAFGQKYPKDGFKKLAWRVMDLVGSLPLGLEVMGSYFRGMSEQEWTEALPNLRAHLDRDGDIAGILKFSYDALCDEDKSLFLYIACFFDLYYVVMVEACLAQSFLDVKLGLQVLSQKSLISIKYGRIHMPKLLIQLGRKIVRQEYPSEPGKRQFLNDAKDIAEVLSDDDKAGNTSVIGIYFDHNEEITPSRSERAFERFSNLQFLRIVGIGVHSQSMNYMSRKLRVLNWRKSLMTCFPSSFNPEFLVELAMTSSNLKKLWKGNKPLNNLVRMDLSSSERLEELPDLSTATNLRAVSLSHCSSLVKLPYSIGNAINLQGLILTDCWRLVDLPASMRNLGSLSELKLDGCSKLEVNLANINLESIEELDLSGCSLLKSYPESSADIQELDPWIGRMSCQNEEAGKFLVRMKKLVSDWLLLKSSHESSTEIQELDLDPWIGRISRLKSLKLSAMRKLVSLPPLPDSLLELDAANCRSLERIDCCFGNPDIRLNFTNCFKLNQEARDLIIQSGKFSVFPAEEVPPCFTYRSSGSSVTVKLNQMPLLGESTKFKVGVICASDEESASIANNKRVMRILGLEDEVYEREEEFRRYSGYIGVLIKEIPYSGSICCSITLGGNSLTYCKKEVEVFHEHLCTFEVEVETEEATSTELVFDFGLRHSTTYEIKECGILPLWEVPLLSFTDGL